MRDKAVALVVAWYLSCSSQPFHITVGALAAEFAHLSGRGSVPTAPNSLCLCSWHSSHGIIIILASPESPQIAPEKFKAPFPEGDSQEYYLPTSTGTVAIPSTSN